MKRLSIGIIGSLLLLYSCSTPKDHSEELATETPEILTGSGLKTSKGSFSITKGIVGQLYDEALENNPELRKLDQQLVAITNDSLRKKTRAFDKYKSTNDAYWRSIDSYVNGINDSITKQSIQKVIDDSKTRYHQRIANHEAYNVQLDELKLKLEDQSTLLKILVTQKMMLNFEQNELTDPKELKSIVEDYNTVIKNTETLVKEER